jgi:hypothetical protein
MTFEPRHFLEGVFWFKKVLEVRWMKTLKGLGLVFVFSLIFGACGSNVPLYEPGTNPGGGEDGVASDDATYALLTAIFEEEEKAELVDDAMLCPPNTEAMAAEYDTFADAKNIATRVKALRVISNSAVYPVYEEKVVKSLKNLLLSNRMDDSIFNEVIKIILSRLSDEEYAKLKELVEKASLQAFEKEESFEEAKAMYVCNCTDKYEEKKKADEDLKYCSQEQVYKFKTVLDSKLTLTERCRVAEEVLTEINRFSPNCVEYPALKSHYHHICLNACESNYIDAFKKYISAVQSPGDKFCVESQNILKKAQTSGACSDVMLREMMKVYDDRCLAASNPVCEEQSKKFEEIYMKSACSDIDALKQTIEEADKAGCDTSAMKKKVDSCQVTPPDRCKEHENAFDASYQKSGCDALADLDNIIMKAGNDGCETAEMKETYEMCKK